jgi:hypothetical protein
LTNISQEKKKRSANIKFELENHSQNLKPNKIGDWIALLQQNCPKYQFQKKTSTMEDIFMKIGFTMSKNLNYTFLK